MKLAFSMLDQNSERETQFELEEEEEEQEDEEEAMNSRSPLLSFSPSTVFSNIRTHSTDVSTIIQRNLRALTI
uniref:Uncharacterized protein n=1 Tax=Bracon brevicornis TaxID=1563983 RepID=A0A6V7L0W9_9HYME